MNVLVCGSAGFVGHAVASALQEQGAHVIKGVSPRRPGSDPNAVVVDFVNDLDPAAWLPRLRGIDAVVNTVGVLRDRTRRPIVAVHQSVPCALFDACAKAGVRRVVQVSALGVAESQTVYARTKRAAEQHLAELTLAKQLDGIVIRPSIIFGRGGASTELFLALSKLPIRVSPKPVQQAVIQPIAVDELAQVIAKLTLAPATNDGVMPIIDAVGPERVPLGKFIANLRIQAGRFPALVIPMPDLLTQWSARLGDALPFVPWCSETLAMLGVDNVGDPAPFEQLLGRPATAFDHLLKSQVAR